MARPAIRLATIFLVVFAGPVIVASAAYLAWRLPQDLAEEREYGTHVRLDDGPHVRWVDDRTVKVARIRFDRARGDFALDEQAMPCPEAQPVVAAMDPNASVDCEPRPAAEPVSETRAPIVAAISDLHGCYRHLATLLQRAGVADARLDWSFGVNHLVIAGDIIDKGPDATRALWLVKKLERQAEDAGGRVHYLLGNHERRALTGGSEIKSRKYREIAERLGTPYATLFSADTELGRWMRRHNVVVRVNDTLFAHGGISQAVLDQDVSLEQLNREARQALAGAGKGKGRKNPRKASAAAWGEDGAASYRGYFDLSFPFGWWDEWRGAVHQADDAAGLVQRVLQRYGLRRIVVGHTEVPRITPMFGGRVIAICRALDTLDRVDAATTAEMLLIDGDRLIRVGVNAAPTPLLP